MDIISKALIPLIALQFYIHIMYALMIIFFLVYSLHTSLIIGDIIWQKAGNVFPIFSSLPTKSSVKLARRGTGTTVNSLLSLQK